MSARHPASDQLRSMADFLDLYRGLDDEGRARLGRLLDALTVEDYDTAEAIFVETLGPERAAPIIADLRR